ncbi:MAG: hypothetical protein C0595_06530 [Marinilabiliales bacterium]|nr:MAG: hypothetical protein C0595_06530 [Marinilabiliales bacterium]
MSRITLFVCLLLIIISPLSGSAQTTDTLSQNSEVFFNQISEILLNTPSKTVKEKSETLIERFQPTWTIGRFNKEEKDAVREVVERMRTKKMRSYPQLYDYIYSLMLLGESKQLPKSIISWHAYTMKLLEDKNTKPFDDFMEFTKELFEDEIISNRRSLAWYYRNAKFSFFADTSLLINFSKLNLVAATRNDSSTLLSTSGTYVYETKQWVGDEARINWTRFGEAYDDSIYVQVKNYAIDMTQADYTIDSAVLHDKRFFKQPMLGIFSDRISSSRSSSKSTYPTFNTYLTDYFVKDLYKEMDFTGGFEHKGLKLYGIGNKYEDAQLDLLHNDTVFARLYSDAFLINNDGMDAAKTEIVFYFDQDSLYHPDLRLKYYADVRQLVLYNENEGSSMIPFFDSYHQLDIYVQALFWKMDDSEMLFKKIRTINNKNKASFVSSNYYSEMDYYRLQGIDEVNPMYVIQNYMKSYNVEEIQLNLLADFMEKPVEQVSAMLIRLSKKGYLVYDVSTETAIVKDRLLNFLKAKSKQTDYDVIRLESNVTAKPNASINLKNYDLDVYGVPFVQISDSQEVYIYPNDKSISFKKNRNFNFDGYVHMGLLDFYTRQSTFVYDSFMLNMNYVDSLAFWVVATDSLRQRDSLVRVKNVITKLNGKLYIDEPMNKSGLKNYPEYPTFKTEEESYVYYNKKEIQDSTLVPETFFYTVDPFIFDSISTFTTNGLAFDGTLNSAGIFKPLKEPLIVMPDYSLGISHNTGSKGYQIYDKKGTFYNDINLDNSGFTGIGKLKYLNSQLNSENFIFYPDSMVARAYDFNSKADVEQYDFPDAQADTVNAFWDIASNNLILKTDNKPFIIYNNSNFKGTLNLNPDKMMGEGAFYFDQSEVISNDIDFKFSKLTADSAIFNLRDLDGENLIFKSSGYFATIDFEKQKGIFNNLYYNSFIEFPFNNYISTLDEMEWDMYNDKLRLTGNLSQNHKALDTLDDYRLIDYKLSGPEFISINPEHDSLRFYAGNADYNLQDYTLDIENVRLLKVADAAIFPKDKKIQIIRDGQIPTLIDARIIADTANKFHSFYNAEVNIFSKHNYSANGYIDYVDRNKIHQAIFMNDIGVNNGMTSAYGSLPPGDIFFLSPEYYFTGDISVKADEKLFRFNGGFQISQQCIDLDGNWISFNNTIDPENIIFKLDTENTVQDSTRAVFGLAFSNTHGSFYPRIFQGLKSNSDKLIGEAKGQLIYDSINKSFKVGTPERLFNNLIDDNLGELDTKRCILNVDGEIDFGLNSNIFKSLAAGKITHKIIPDSTYVNTSLLLDFFIDKKVIKMMTDSLQLSNNTPATHAEGTFPVFLKKVVGTERSALMITELALYGKIKKLPDELKHTLIFSDLNLRWHNESKSFVSVGKIGLGFADEEPVNKYFDGYVQIEMGRTGSGITILLKSSENQYYFFSYKYGIMQIMSSDYNFNAFVEELKPEKRMLNPESDTDYYEYVISTRRKVIDFERKMNEINKF